MDNNVVNHQSEKSTYECEPLDAKIKSAETQKVYSPNRKITNAVRQKVISKEDDSRL